MGPTVVQRLSNLRLRLEGALVACREDDDDEAVAWLSDGVDALNAAINRIKLGNITEGLWLSAEKELAERGTVQ